MSPSECSLTLSNPKVSLSECTLIGVTIRMSPYTRSQTFTPPRPLWHIHRTPSHLRRPPKHVHSFTPSHLHRPPWHLHSVLITSSWLHHILEAPVTFLKCVLLDIAHLLPKTIHFVAHNYNCQLIWEKVIGSSTAKCSSIVLQFAQSWNNYL